MAYQRLGFGSGAQGNGGEGASIVVGTWFQDFCEVLAMDSRDYLPARQQQKQQRDQLLQLDTRTAKMEAGKKGKSHHRGTEVRR